MKHYQQEGKKLEKINLSESGNVCTCCQDYSHGASEYLHDDAECGTCGELCCCKCHRPDNKR